MSIYVQIGAGAGDLDIRGGYRDGFTQFVKGLDPSSITKILCIEPNILNIENLKECWKDYPQTKILNIGLSTRKNNNSDITFYYALEDCPHYQTASTSIHHVHKHYPHGTIQEFVSKCYDLQSIIAEHIGLNNTIELLALDIEDLEFEIILDTDWSMINCNSFSFENYHMNESQKVIINHYLESFNFVYAGKGLDPNGIDSMYKKVK